MVVLLVDGDMSVFCVCCVTGGAFSDLSRPHHLIYPKLVLLLLSIIYITHSIGNVSKTVRSDVSKLRSDIRNVRSLVLPWMRKDHLRTLEKSCKSCVEFKNCLY